MGYADPVPRALVVSPAADRRLERAAAWLGERRRDEEILILGASLSAPDDLVRLVAGLRGASFGWTRSTLGRVATALAGPALAARGLVPVGALPLEALAARVVDALRREGALGRFQAVAGFPGLPRALARTLAELRLAGIEPEALDAGCPAIARVQRAYEAELAGAGLADRALVFRLATIAAREGTERQRARSCSSICPSHAALERDLVAALAARAPEVLALVPEGDERADAAPRRRARRRAASGPRRPRGRRCDASKRTCSRVRPRRRESWATPSSCSPRPARAASAWRSRGWCSARPSSAACPSIAWPSCCARRRSTAPTWRRRCAALESPRTSRAAR